MVDIDDDMYTTSRMTNSTRQNFGVAKNHGVKNRGAKFDSAILKIKIFILAKPKLWRRP